MTTTMTTAGTKRPLSGDNADSSSAQSIRLLVHAVDGAIPYLTPSLLQKCFPLEQYDSHLWIGLAVRDTCVAPVFSPSKTMNSIKAAAPKPSGYTFSANTSPDPWLLNYTRVTVPTFDPVQDAIHCSPKKSADTSTITSSSTHLMVWTENGRQQITPEQYYSASDGLRSHASVSLFDVCLSDSSQRRRRTALQRATEWASEMMEREKQNIPKGDHTEKKWGAYLIAPTNNGEKDREAKHQHETLQQALDTNKLSGIAFVGWQYATNHENQISLLQSAIKQFRLDVRQTSEDLAVLSTDSLLQILDTACLGINVIGTNLPARWAKAKKAAAFSYSGWKNHESKRMKVGQECDISQQDLDENGCFSVLAGNAIDDKGGAWIRDSQPILPGCSCMTCRKHSRSYIYHLVMTKELLSEILLFIHNLHHLLGLIRELSEALKDDNQDVFCTYIKSQIHSVSV